MQKMMRGMAVVLTATMVLGNAVTAFAADNSGTSTGTGTSEGHVEKKATNVVLPVETTDYTASTFSYTMDPERLISGSAGKKYADDATFPEAESDTGVYFLTEEKTYENASKALKVTNQSSHDIELTVTAEAESADTDIPLVAKDAIANADNASLYLGLVVGADAGKAITKDTAATSKVTVAGKAENFKVDVKSDKSGYEYRALTLDEYKALDGNAAKTEIEWASQTFNLEGSVTKDKAITSSTTAPSVKVTWSWTDPTEGPQVSMDTNGLITLTNLDGTQYANLTLNDGIQEWPLRDADGTWVWEDSVDSVKTFQLGENWVPDYLSGKNVVITVNLKDGSKLTSASVTMP